MAGRRFRFRLDSLLRIKEHLEREKQKELAIATAKVLSQQQELGRIKNATGGTLNRQRDCLGETLSVSQLSLFSRFLVRLKKEHVMAHEILNGLTRVQDKNRDALLEATKERKIYQKLKEKAHDKHQKEATLDEMKESDEAGMNAYRQRHLLSS